MYKSKQAKIIDLGLSFLIIALTISHRTTCQISGGQVFQLEPLSSATQRLLNRTVRFHAHLCLSVLLERTLRRLLSHIENYLKSPRREEWAATCFAICLLLLGAESLQVDVYINGIKTEANIDVMEDGAIRPLVCLFRESTNGSNPLMIGWNKDRNVNDFLQANTDIIYALQDLQDLTKEYSKSPILSFPDAHSL